MEFFISDEHYNHIKIIELSKRPFESVEEMNETLVNNHNSVVSNDDIVYHGGDICMGIIRESIKIIPQLNGTQVLIAGNHDNCFNKTEKSKWIKIYLDSGISEIHQVLVLEGDQYKEVGGKIRIQHFPIKEALKQDNDKYDIRYMSHRLSSDGNLHLSGHTHSKEKIAGYKNIHIGSDAWNFTPISLDQIISLYKEQAW